MKRPFYILLFFILSLCGLNTQSQNIPYPLSPERPVYRKSNSFFRPDSLPNRNRKLIVAGLFTGTYGGIYSSLSLAWYKGTHLTKFHWFNDMNEWKQVDKYGHAMGAYQGGRAMIQILKWAGCKKGPTLFWGGLSSFAMLSTLEVFDGVSDGWGASIYDIGANFLGSSLAVGNEALWNEQRIQIKISWHPTNYPLQVDDNILGNNWTRFIKDYNGHTHWLSVRVHSFLKEGELKRIWPRWLNIAAGFGAEGLLGGYDDPAQAWKKREYRKFYLGLDVDLSRIRTKIGVIDWILGTINFIHIPAPAIEFSKHGVKLHAFYL